MNLNPLPFIAFYSILIPNICDSLSVLPSAQEGSIKCDDDGIQKIIKENQLCGEDAKSILDEESQG